MQDDHMFLGDNTLIMSKPNKVKLLNGRTGYFPTLLFTNSNHSGGNSNISIIGFTLDGNDQGFRIGKAKDRSGVSSLLKFIRTTNLNLNDIHIKRYYSNFWDFKSLTSLTEEEERGYTAIDVRWSENIYLQNFTLSDSRREGLEFWRSKNVYLENFQSKNTDLCTPLSAWFSENIQLTKSIIDE
ncbi:unnamed protein product, partial [Hapterophycus canaliculatus]